MHTLRGLGLAAVLAATVSAQQSSPGAFPPGFVDPAPILAAAAKEIGEASLQCVTFSGTGYSGAVGQAFESGVNIDWPRIDALANYRRTINYATRTIIEEFDRKPGLNPASWKYGLGWQDGTPVQKNLHQTFIVSGDHGWHIDGAGGTPVPMSPEDVSIGQLEIWMNPHGFLKAARLPGANPKAVWRWELGEMGRDGPTTVPDKVHVVSITLGKYRVDATINKQNQIQRIHTMVAEPALGDFNYEHESTDQQTFGAVKFPIAWHSHQGWDDNFGFENVTAGHNAFGGTFPKVEPNNCGPAITVPDAVRRASTAPPAGHRGQAGRRRLPARRRAGQQHRGGVQDLRRRVRGAHQRGAQPGGHRADREADAEQADPLPGELAPALRSHRRHPRLPAHRRDHRHAAQEHHLPEPRRAQLPSAHGAARHGQPVAADRSRRGLQLRELQRELRHHRRLAPAARVSTCSRCSTPRGWPWRICRRRRS